MSRFAMYKRKDFTQSERGLNGTIVLCIIGTQSNSMRGDLIERSQVLRDDSSTQLAKAWRRLDKYTEFHAYRFGQISRLNDKEDFVAIGQTVVWKCLKRYRPVCPVCGRKYLSMEKYKKHRHNNRIHLPLYSFDSFARMRILSAFQSEIKKEVAQKRSPSTSVGPFPYEPAHFSSGYGMIDLNEVFDYLLKDFDSVQKAIIQMLADHYTVSDIVLLVEPHGYSLNYVRDTIRKFRTDLKSYYKVKKSSKAA